MVSALDAYQPIETAPREVGGLLRGLVDRPDSFQLFFMTWDGEHWRIPPVSMVGTVVEPTHWKRP